MSKVYRIKEPNNERSPVRLHSHPDFLQSRGHKQCPDQYGRIPEIVPQRAWHSRRSSVLDVLDPYRRGLGSSAVSLGHALDKMVRRKAVCGRTTSFLIEWPGHEAVVIKQPDQWQEGAERLRAAAAVRSFVQDNPPCISTEQAQGWELNRFCLDDFYVLRLFRVHGEENMWQIMLAVSRRKTENETVPEIDPELLFQPLQSVALSPIEPNYDFDSQLPSSK